MTPEQRAKKLERMSLMLESSQLEQARELIENNPRAWPHPNASVCPRFKCPVCGELITFMNRFPRLRNHYVKHFRLIPDYWGGPSQLIRRLERCWGSRMHIDRIVELLIGFYSGETGPCLVISPAGFLEKDRCA
jgi:hypothetical protein